MISHDSKDNQFYTKSKNHDKVKAGVHKRKVSMRSNQAEYTNGNVKVVTF